MCVEPKDNESERNYLLVDRRRTPKRLVRRSKEGTRKEVASQKPKETKVPWYKSRPD